MNVAVGVNCIIRSDVVTERLRDSIIGRKLVSPKATTKTKEEVVKLAVHFNTTDKVLGERQFRDQSDGVTYFHFRLANKNIARWVVGRRRRSLNGETAGGVHIHILVNRGVVETNLIAQRTIGKRSAVIKTSGEDSTIVIGLPGGIAGATTVRRGRITIFIEHLISVCIENEVRAELSGHLFAGREVEVKKRCVGGYRLPQCNDGAGHQRTKGHDKSCFTHVLIPNKENVRGLISTALNV